MKMMTSCTGGDTVPGTPVAAAGADGFSYTFGNETTQAVLTALGGSYSICWCIGLFDQAGCFLGSHFGVDVGSVRVIGPDGNADASCVKSLPCSVPMTGEGLEDSDAVLVAVTLRGALALTVTTKKQLLLK